MHAHLWNNWYFGLGWGWFLWLGIVLLLFFSMVNWRYAFAVLRKHRLDAGVQKDAPHRLNARYAGGEITREEFNHVKSDISKTA
ncbi:SHOCT domain-containing protein [Rhodanobacter sp. AS-Z3]|uniref:SHOCT domain-containing protein n=1 Tax=Rhodanobacter sp. AS-Z3 TaxID=3031330 RepID=UPI002479E8D8|nr:SHOCT domain-containing protein [Rhodanobacter sp. AS-Z3]WEN16565.1 SHOCT domain-containing protein [Rhodanobacter sp. AS-Z3]